ncbi:MAG: single-stranded DNA-specific exonuclease [Candidatus Thermoplasmatota archaeon]
MLDKLEGNGLLIHHWDADGICSAKLLLEKIGDKIENSFTPTLGNYFLTNEEIEKCRGYDFVIIVDMSLPKKNILKLNGNSQVLIFDHHLGEEIKQVFHRNPVIKGKNPDEYPSASWIVNDYLDNSVNLFALLGVVGDHEQKIKNNNQFFSLIESFCQEKNIVFEDMLRMVYLLDSNYKKGNKKAVEKAPYILLKVDEPRQILENKEWNQNKKMLDDEIEKQLNEPLETTDDTIIKKMNSPFNIISTITRRLAWDTQKNTIVVNTGFFDDEDQLYVRTLNKNMEPMIQRGKKLGFKCGGKKEVLGAIIPKNQTESFLEEVKNFFMED